MTKLSVFLKIQISILWSHDSIYRQSPAPPISFPIYLSAENISRCDGDFWGGQVLTLDRRHDLVTTGKHQSMGGVCVSQKNLNI